jgi:glutamate synthase (NADPH/NADH) large chain
MKDDNGKFHLNAAGVPAPRGLYDPALEHDSCGVGFVVRLDGMALHTIVESAVRILVNLEHRGALGGDKSTGDGAGLMVRTPDTFFRKACGAPGRSLPAPGDYAAGMVFLPTMPAIAERCVKGFERIALEEGCPVLWWREVPVNPEHLGELARSTLPEIRQCMLSRGAIPADDFERKLYVVRRRMEKEAASWRDCDASQFYVTSLSSRTLVYKGMLTGSQLDAFYPDLKHEMFESPFAVVHQRYSTNTLPTWHLAHPFRFLAHNGEINTLRGNINRMHSREATMASELLGADIEKIKPVIVEGGSDSAVFDNAL